MSAAEQNVQQGPHHWTNISGRCSVTCMQS